MKRIDSTRYKTVAFHVVSTTASIQTGRAVVGLRIDDGTSDDILLNAREARALAKALNEYASRIDILNAKESR